MNELPQVVCSFQEQQHGKSLPSGTQHTQILSLAAVTSESSCQWPVSCRTRKVHPSEKTLAQREPSGTKDPGTDGTLLPILDTTVEGWAFPGEGGERRAACSVFNPLFSWGKSPGFISGNYKQQSFAGREVWLYRSFWTSWDRQLEKNNLGSVYVPLRSHITHLPS